MARPGLLVILLAAACSDGAGVRPDSGAGPAADAAVPPSPDAALDAAVAPDGAPAPDAAPVLDAGAACDFPAYPDHCTGDLYRSCSVEGLLVVTDCAALGMTCIHDWQSSFRGCGACDRDDECRPPEPGVCEDAITITHHVMSCSAGRCGGELLTEECTNDHPTYCDGFTLWEPAPPSCSINTCTGGGVGQTCFGGCAEGRCLPVGGLSWSRFAAPEPAGPGLNAIVALWASAEDDVWTAVGLFDAWRWDGEVWSSEVDGFQWGIFGAGSERFVVGDDGDFQRRSGGVWSSVASGTELSLYDVHGDGAGEVWAVGEDGVIVHWNGAAAVARTDVTDAELDAVWVVGPGDVWAAGVGDTLLHLEAGVWTPRPTGLVADWIDLWATPGGDEVFAVGDGFVVRRAGEVWVEQDLPTPFVTWYGVWGRGGGDVYAVGSGGWIVHFDGLAWSAEDSGVTSTLTRVWGLAVGPIFAGGAFGDLLRGD